MAGIFGKLFSEEQRELSALEKIADQVLKYEPEMQALSDDELRAKTDEYRKRIADGETVDDLLPETFATAREAAYRVINEKPYKVQIMGSIAMHKGDISEMKTGEGKTLTATMCVYLNALAGQGVHVITVNEYLAGRDAAWMGEIYRFLGLTVGVNTRDLKPREKRDAYACDITYTTNSELGFDYLRDNMVTEVEDRVMRGLHMAVIDEVDSVLIDEARTPLIISGGVMKSANLYKDADRFVKTLRENEDYTIDEKTKDITLTDQGTEKGEKYFRIANLYDIEHSALVHHVNQALKANYTMHNDVDYVVQEGKVVIVDQFTGRLMPGRAFSDGLHQAIEAKENVEIEEETKTLATITFQNYFRMYEKLSGMTGTAKTEEEEFRNIYNMYVIEIPTNLPVIRVDAADLIYSTKEEKYKAIIAEIKRRHEKGQPVLVGTIAIETNELLSSMLKKAHIKHEILNAKNHAREAEIIAKAGEKGSVTIATNMAGRGTDIKLGEGVKELGGLCVIGTERHESRRIDNQLRGRSGRQGDPGYSQFFVSFEDELMVRFGTDRFKSILEMAGLDSERNMRSKTITRSVETAQKRVEGNNFDARKHLLQYDDVMGKHREIMYARRNEILDNEDVHNYVINTMKELIELLVRRHTNEHGVILEADCNEIVEYVNENLLNNSNLKLSEILNKEINDIIDVIQNKVLKEYEEKIKELPDEIRKDFEKAISLQVIDNYWMEHINTMDHLREGVSLRGYANEDPLQAYIREGFELFDKMLDNICKDTTLYLLKAEIRQNLQAKQVKGSTNEAKEQGVKKTIKKGKKIGRNDMCPCGSGKKYKQCCGK